MAHGPLGPLFSSIWVFPVINQSIYFRPFGWHEQCRPGHGFDFCAANNKFTAPGEGFQTFPEFSIAAEVAVAAGCA